MPEYRPDFKIDALSMQREGKESRELSVEASHMVAFRLGEHPGFRQWVKVDMARSE